LILIALILTYISNINKVRSHVVFVWTGDNIKYGNPKNLNKAFRKLHAKLNLKGAPQDWLFCDNYQASLDKPSETRALIHGRDYIVIPRIKG